MPSDTTYEKIAALLHEVDEKLKSASASSIREKHLTQDLGLDSLDVIKFVLLVEEKFGCTIPDEEIDSRGLLKIDNLAAYLAERGAA
ncbi:MAG: acyl carrier protein [Burkholderiales bacterium]